MQVLSELISGIRGAENGQANIYERGTSTLATVYADYDGTVARPQPLDLDSFGGTEVYVNEEVDVRVQDADGVTVRQFSPMGTSNSIEYVGKSFTGRRYSDALSAVNQPITAQAIFDLWKDTNGATDWKVLFGGSAVSIQEAVAGIAGVFFNVKDPLYGAVGDGATDDATAIQATITAAAIVKGIVLFPAGTYRVTTKLTVPAGVSLWGMGASGSVVKMDHATADLLEYGAGSLTSAQEIRNLGLTVAQANTGKLVSMTGAGSRQVHIYGCVIGDSAGLHTGDCAVVLGSGFTRMLVADSTVWMHTSGGIDAAQAAVTLEMRNTTMRVVSGAYNGALVKINFGSLVGCRFECDVVSSGIYAGIIVDGTHGPPGVQIAGNYFIAGAGASIAIQLFSLNSGGTRVVEVANSFLNWTTNGNGWIAQSNNPQLQNLSRDARALNLTDNTATVDLKGDEYGLVILTRSAAGGAQALTSAVSSPGAKLMLIIVNASGGALSADPSVNSGGFYAGNPSMKKPANAHLSVATFESVYTGGAAAWVATSVHYEWDGVSLNVAKLGTDI